MVFVLREKKPRNYGVFPIETYTCFIEYSYSELFDKIKEIFSEEISELGFDEEDEDDEWDYKTFDILAPIIIKRMLVTVVKDIDGSDNDYEVMLTRENEKQLDLSLPERYRDECDKKSIIEYSVDELNKIKQFYKVGEYDDYVENEDEHKVDCSNWEENFKSESDMYYYYCIDNLCKECLQMRDNYKFIDYNRYNEQHNDFTEYDKFLYNKVFLIIQHRKILGTEESFIINSGLKFDLLKDGKMKEELKTEIIDMRIKANKRRDIIIKITKE